MSIEPTEPSPPISVLSPVVSGLLGRCPQCGKGSMFKDLLALAETCTVCGFDFRDADPGDGPAFFASFIGGFIVLGIGVWLQIAYEPAIWVYVVVFLVGILVCLGLLRGLKGILVSLQYANKAGQGRFDP